MPYRPNSTSKEVPCHVHATHASSPAVPIVCGARHVAGCRVQAGGWPHLGCRNRIPVLPLYLLGFHTE
eukprot:3170773-Amphidinium_carterae.1